MTSNSAQQPKASLTIPVGADASKQMQLELPIIEGSMGEKAIDISRLRPETGYITLDPGLMNTGSCESSITYLSGEQGILRYRGIPIEELAISSNFLETSYLLIHGELPTPNQYIQFRDGINRLTKLPSGIKQLIESFPPDAHPMAVLSAGVVALSGYFKNYLHAPLTKDEIPEVISLICAYVPVMSAHFYRHTQGKKAFDSRSDLPYAKDFLHMMFGEKSLSFDEKVSKALDMLFILHADHEQNCSASTVRVTGSGKANIFACISSGINALWGPLHGGANQAVLEMLQTIQNDSGNVQKYIELAKTSGSNFRLMGFGHRVYKNFDPRAKIIKQSCDQVLKALGVSDPLLEIAYDLEQRVLSDSYFQERKLYPNVDFYSGIIYRALGIPTNMFTVMFAIGRTPGWIAQWLEMHSDKSFRITRPRQIYQGIPKRPWEKKG